VTVFGLLVNADKPTAPRELRAADRNKDSITLAWKSPESDGGSPVLSYVVERREGTRATWSKIGDASSESLRYRATRLTEGTEYQFRVAAENTIGLGPFVTLDEAVKASLPFGNDRQFKLTVKRMLSFVTRISELSRVI